MASRYVDIRPCILPYNAVMNERNRFGGNGLGLDDGLRLDSGDRETLGMNGPILSMLLPGMAGAMAWGIRGQYGHETGAMIAGVLIGFTIVLLHGRRLPPLVAARAVAMFALGISIGGCMTYGQTVGLTHDTPLVGNAAAYWWGMLGLAIKGGIWFSFGGAMFGMALGGKEHRPAELALLFVAMMAALFAGMWLLNSPFDPENRLLPKIYFSDHWDWEPDVDRPRREKWGGLLASLLVLFFYLAAKRDWMAMSLGLWGLLGGALGFPAGQSIQACNAWHGDWIRSLPTAAVTNYFNWWNMMETTFGFVAGGIVGLGSWLHQSWIGSDLDESAFVPNSGDSSLASEYDEASGQRFFDPVLGLLLLMVHLCLLVAWNFQSIDFIDRFADLAIPMIILPTFCVLSGRYWPFLMSLPVVLVPIAGKTIRFRVFDQQTTSVETGWYLYVVLPLALATLTVLFFATRKSSRVQRWFVPTSLVVSVWLLFLLNDAFFYSPWVWLEWTGRTVNGLIFFVCSICLTLAALWSCRLTDELTDD